MAKTVVPKTTTEVKTIDQLQAELSKAQADIAISRRSHKQGELVNPKILNIQRKAIARIKTAITVAEKEAKESK